MRLRTALAATALWASAATAQVDPLAPLPPSAPPLSPSAPIPQSTRPLPAWVPPRVVYMSPLPPALTGFAAYKTLLADRARRAGVGEATIQGAVPWLSLNSRVIQLDRAQPGGTANPNAIPAFAPYRRQHVNAALVRGGAARYAANASKLEAIEARSGVEASVLMAIFGHETSFGAVTGNFDLLEALATLAYEGRRRALFADEFIALLKMADRGVPRRQMLGSWAGAFGNPQFLPTIYLRLARDGDGDGRADIWNSRADTLASIANYFRDAGWRRGEPWGVKVSVPATFDRAALPEKLEAPSCRQVHARHSAWRTVAEWKALGLSPQAPIADQTMATLFEPDGQGNGGFLLTGNYRVILHYNCSNYYALSVGLLADEIVR